MGGEPKLVVLYGEKHESGKSIGRLISIFSNKAATIFESYFTGGWLSRFWRTVLVKLSSTSLKEIGNTVVPFLTVLEGDK